MEKIHLHQQSASLHHYSILKFNALNEILRYNYFEVYSQTKYLKTFSHLEIFLSHKFFIKETFYFQFHILSLSITIL